METEHTTAAVVDCQKGPLLGEETSQVIRIARYVIDVSLTENSFQGVVDTSKHSAIISAGRNLIADSLR